MLLKELLKKDDVFFKMSHRDRILVEKKEASKKNALLRA